MKSAVAPGRDDGGESESNIKCPENEIHRLREELQQLKQKLIENYIQVADGSNFSKIQNAGSPPEKSGYLFKWQDRTIGWSGTKWGLRFVRLEYGQISYYRSHEEVSPRYILTLKNCAVRDEGSKLNKRHSVESVRKSGRGSATGSHFHVFSIYQQSADAKKLNAGGTLKMDDDINDQDADDNDINIVPLLRFSTQSLAEKAQWIDLISQHCAFCDSNEFREIQGKLRRQNQQSGMTEKGTLPALYFEPPHTLTSVPSGYKLDQISKRHRSKSNSKDSARSNNISYPPSKPMHRQSNPSYLSEGAHKQNYRGLFNLLVIILVVSNFRLILDAVSKHGFILNKIGTLSDFWQAEWSEKMVDFPFLSGLLIVQVFVVGSYAIEKMLCQAWIGECFGMVLHMINTNASLGVVTLVVWHLIKHPLKGAALILQATITWLKLISYVHANHDYRATVKETHKAMSALVKDLDDEGLRMTYPQNVTLGNIYFFWFAPTLTYQIAFPRTPYIRWDKVITLTIRLFISATFVTFLAAQVIAPNLDNLLRDLEANKGQPISHIDVIGSYLLKLSLTSTYIWLLTFYGFFHCFLNISAELLRFGDRVFYRDWWNASEVSAYWRLWNMPVHYWLVRHVYFPSIRIGLSKKGATFVVFFVSAIMHEVLISIPCHMVRAWSFLAMMGQLPLIILTKYIDKRNPGSSIGNIIFWISFCFVGQPMAILLYTIDYWEINHQNRLDEIPWDDAKQTPKQRGSPLAMIVRVFGASPEL